MLTNATGGLLLQTMLYLVSQKENNTALDTNSLYQINNIEGSSVTDNEVTRCYGIYGCFQISSPWISDTRPVSLFPEDPGKINPHYLMYTGSNHDTPFILDVNNPDVIQQSGMDGKLPVYVVAHGYMDAATRPWVHKLVFELLQYQPCTVIAVDWHGGSSPPYSQAVANIRLVGVITAHVLAGIAHITGDKKLDNVHMIGHSLGAHLAGYVGYTLQNEFGLKLGRITGLDPAEPHFAKSDPKIRLDRSAAKFVDVIHTDASGIVKGGFGILENIGHIDYYPNGGAEQPGCSDGVFQYIAKEKGSFFLGVKKYISCSHVRSYEYFTESIRSACPYLSIRCGSYEYFKTGQCFECNKRGQFCLKFGLMAIESYRALEKSGRIAKDQPLITYFMTGNSPPFCRSHYRITAQLSNSTEALRHGGEIGQLWITVHGTKGRTGKLPLQENHKHYEPGKVYMNVVPGAEVGYPISVTAEWEFETSIINPLTWRILANPRIYLDSIIIESMEHKSRMKVCPPFNTEFNTNQPRNLLPTYCKS